MPSPKEKDSKHHPFGLARWYILTWGCFGSRRYNGKQILFPSTSTLYGLLWVPHILCHLMVHLVQCTCTTTEGKGLKGDHGFGSKPAKQPLGFRGPGHGDLGWVRRTRRWGFQETTTGIERQLEQLWVWRTSDFPMPSTRGLGGWQAGGAASNGLRGHGRTNEVIYPTERLTCWGHLQSYHYHCREFCGLSKCPKTTCFFDVYLVVPPVKVYYAFWRNAMQCHIDDKYIQIWSICM